MFLSTGLCRDGAKFLNTIIVVGIFQIFLISTYVMKLNSHKKCLYLFLLLFLFSVISGKFVFVASNIVFIIWRRFRNMLCWKFNLTIFLFVAPSNKFSFFILVSLFSGWSINFRFNKKKRNKKKKIQIYFQSKNHEKGQHENYINCTVGISFVCRPFYHTTLLLLQFITFRIFVVVCQTFFIMESIQDSLRCFYAINDHVSFFYGMGSFPWGNLNNNENQFATKACKCIFLYGIFGSFWTNFTSSSIRQNLLFSLEFLKLNLFSFFLLILKHQNQRLDLSY